MEMRLNMTPRKVWTRTADQEPIAMVKILALPAGRRRNDSRAVKSKGAEKLKKRGSSDFKTGRERGRISPFQKGVLNSLPGGRIKNDG